MRTIQRIEKDGSASLQSKKALAAALDIDSRDLDDEEKTLNCPVCRSSEIYQHSVAYSLAGEELLPGLGGTFIGAKIRPSLCLNCGHILLFASEEARKKARTSKHWKAAAAGAS